MLELFFKIFHFIFFQIYYLVLSSLPCLLKLVFITYFYKLKVTLTLGHEFMDSLYRAQKKLKPVMLSYRNNATHVAFPPHTPNPFDGCVINLEFSSGKLLAQQRQYVNEMIEESWQAIRNKKQQALVIIT